MPKRTKIIFIVVFILVGALMLGYYFYFFKPAASTTKNSSTSTYNSFTPIDSTNGGSSTITPTTNTNGLTDQGTTTQIGTTGETPQISKFHKLTDFAVAGASYFEDTRLIPQTDVAIQVVTPTTAPKKSKVAPAKVIQPKYEIVPAIRYVERSTGHIYEMYLDTKVTGEVSNSTIPNIYEALFDSKAQSIVYRYLGDDNRTINSFLATLGGTKGQFLPANILDVSLSPDKNKFFYLTETTNGVAGITQSFNETKTTQIFTSSFSEWLSQWVADKTVYLTTKAAASADGYLFSLNTTTGVITKLFGGVKGLTTLANTKGSLVLYSTSINNSTNLGIFIPSTHSTNNLNTSGLPEKCVWASDNITVYCAKPNSIDGGEYPDIWYRGQVSFNDQFVKLNTQTNGLATIADSSTETPLDGTHLFLNKAEDQLFFINKKDSTLWSLDLK